MSLNRFNPHVVIVPEDELTGNIAIGFVSSDMIRENRFAVVNPRKGWTNVIDAIARDDFNLRKHSNCVAIAIIDFDGDYDNRIQAIKQRIPPDLLSRVVILGFADEAKAMSKNWGGSHTLGRRLGDECASGLRHTWQSNMLIHNIPELDRLTELGTELGIDWIAYGP